jgi:hypothetical protein
VSCKPPETWTPETAETAIRDILSDEYGQESLDAAESALAWLVERAEQAEEDDRQHG